MGGTDEWNDGGWDARRNEQTIMDASKGRGGAGRGGAEILLGLVLAIIMVGAGRSSTVVEAEERMEAERRAT